MAYLSMGEAHRRITEYLNRFSDAVLTQDGSSLKQLLSISSNSPLLLSLADALNLFHDSNRLLKQSDRFSQISEIVSPLFRSIQNFRLGNLLDSYNAFEKAAKYLSFFKTLIYLFIYIFKLQRWFIMDVDGGIAVLSFRSFGIGSRRGRWRLCMSLLTKLGFLPRE